MIAIRRRALFIEMLRVASVTIELRYIVMGASDGFGYFLHANCALLPPEHGGGVVPPPRCVAP